MPLHFRSQLFTQAQPNGNILAICGGNIFYLLPNQTDNGKYLVVLRDIRQGEVVPLGVAESQQSGLSYIKTMDTKFLLQVA